MRLMLCIFLVAGTSPSPAAEFFVRANQIGYRTSAPKIAIAFGQADLPGRFTLRSVADAKVRFEGTAKVADDPSWGRFQRHARLDFTRFNTAGRYVIEYGDASSAPFAIGHTTGDELPDQLLEFMRQQRCGFNPWLDAACHQLDGRTAYGPLTPGTWLDARGGWHDAGDQLKYLITSGNATAQMLLAYLVQKPKTATRMFADRTDARGKSVPNGIPDVLDEARWGLEWMLKLHPAPDQLYHMVGDDRDHVGMRLPPEDTADYGWGKGSYRVVYGADGKPQGLAQYQSESTGMANIAGRYAAAMGLAWQVWGRNPRQRDFAERCLKAGREVYELGRAQEGSQQGNSYRAPYRYEETTWADDMEWGAAELYRATGDRRYLEEAKHYALRAATESWMGQEQAKHYQYYPFMNVGHYRLHGVADRACRKVLAGYYREEIERCVRAGRRNPYQAGVPFIWCSNNLMTALATECLLYELMTGDTRYREFGAAQQDWLLGRNPWGYSMFTGIGTVYPTQPHLVTTHLTRRGIRGGLVDGPVYERIFRSLKGVSITEPDPLAEFQGPAVFHDDFHDYSTNEPTMDGTASAILLWALAGRGAS